MLSNKPKLIIWDFDGVIADTEILWLKNRQKLLNEKFDLNWDIDTTNIHLGGMSDKTKKHVLEKMNISTDNDFWKEIIQLDYKTMEEGISTFEGVEEIMKEIDIPQCIATGGIKEKTLVKIKAINFDKFFPLNNIFTSDMVEHGKPEPDLFLHAAKTMEVNPQDCIVIEDSIAGLTAAIKAGMTPIAFTGSDINKTDIHLKNIKNLGIKFIFDKMIDVKMLLQHINI